MSDPQAKLKEFKPKYDRMVAIDSDGCVFDTMEIKQKECFTPNTIKHFGLQGISKYARETAEWVNLYSRWRGVNRFPALVKVFDLLKERPEVLKRNVPIPEARELRKFIDSGVPLGNPTLKELVEKDRNPELERALEWSLEINRTIAGMVKEIPPFPYVVESLEKLSNLSDSIVVSQTPCEALNREWEEHGVDKYVEIIAGQEMGKKSEHIKLATEGRYSPDRILMIGDAMGDLRAAHINDALFYPIVPGAEEESWEQFYKEEIDRFISGGYTREYEKDLIAKFEKFLPETPPWKTA